MKKLLASLLLGTACTFSYCANWVKVYDDGAQQVFLDKSSQALVRGQEKIWSKWTFATKQIRPDVKPFRSYSKLKFYDCTDGTWKTRRALAYDGPNLTGRLLYSAEYPNENLDEDDIMPTIDQPAAQSAMTKVVCDS